MHWNMSEASDRKMFAEYIYSIRKNKQMVSIKIEWHFKPNTELGVQGYVFYFSKFMQQLH